jgi:hypothetical protein
MRRVAIIMAFSVALATWGCGPSGDDQKAVSTPTTEAGSDNSTTSVTTSGRSAPARGGNSTTTDSAATARFGSRSSTTTTPVDRGAPAAARPTVRVSLFAEAGETPPGRVQPLDSPAWKATGAGWRPGDVDLAIRRAGETVLAARGRAVASGNWELTFVLARPGTYVAVASEGPLSAEISFVVRSSPAASQVVDTGTSPAGQWQLLAERQAGGVLCAVLTIEGRDEGQVCNEASEQDFNGDGVLRYAVFGDGAFVIGVSASGVETVRAELLDGTRVERPTAEVSFAGSRFIALPLPAQSVIRTLVALGHNGQGLSELKINP